ncbi:hypothetical protein, partial [Parabacteroides sp.]|uniref:hypothetical protein n=1 Tax=Parabacteroides sp. TaxID=1869337 RepID=UPI00291015B6
ETGKFWLSEVRACLIFFADTKKAISNFYLRQPLQCLCSNTATPIAVTLHRHCSKKSINTIYLP